MKQREQYALQGVPRWGILLFLHSPTAVTLTVAMGRGVVAVPIIAFPSCKPPAGKQGPAHVKYLDLDRILHQVMLRRRICTESS
jgi:hypothetical protein